MILDGPATLTAVGSRGDTGWFSGTVEAGSVAVGDVVDVVPAKEAVS
jgi:MOSC domain-containing protein YiiM